MPRSVEELRKAWKKATKEKPIRIAEDEWENFREATHEPPKNNKFTRQNIYVKKEFSYISPMSGKEISCYGKRREEMKQYGVREVAPDEYNNKLKDLGFYDRKHPE